MSAWTWLWLGWLAAFALIEGAALINKGRGDTLSEHVWSWFQIRDSRKWTLRRFTLALFLVWLLVHMVA